MRGYSFVGRRYGWISILVALMATTPPVRAQDVTIGSSEWFFGGNAPDELAKTIKVIKPDYPADMRKTAETGYVIVFRYIDAKGEARGVPMYGTHLPFERAVEESVFHWKISPAKRGGVPVGSWSSIPIIFNPKVANADAPDCIPRLLAVEPAILPAGTDKPGESFFVPVKFSLDESGAIVRTDVETAVDERFRAAVQSALKNWRFAPARRGGKAVGAEITLPFCCLSLWPKNAGNYVPPQVLNAVEPDYPYVMAKFGINGRVTVEFIIDRDGSIRNPVIVESNNPAFDEPALEALLKWKFKAGEIEGVTTKVLARQSIEFAVDNGGNHLFEVRGRPDQSKLPPELRYDVSAKVRSVEIPVYPYAQRQGNIRGTAKATALIGKDGRVVLVKIRSADQPEFGQALTAALERFTFDPALKDGKPAQELINFEQIFDRAQLPDEDSERLLGLEKKHPERIVSANMLDLPLKPLSTKRPTFPRELLEKATTGETVIEILIDEKGHAKLPRVVSASEPAFGYAAVQAVSSWWFQPPHQNGKPVITRVRVPIDFKVELPVNDKSDERKPAA